MFTPEPDPDSRHPHRRLSGWLTVVAGILFLGLVMFGAGSVYEGPDPASKAAVDAMVDRIAELPKAFRVLQTVAAVNGTEVLFERGSAELSEDARSTLQALTPLLASLPSYAHIEVVGHRNPKDSSPRARTLAAKRAERVVSHLRSNGVADAQLIPVVEDSSQVVAAGALPSETKALAKAVTQERVSFRPVLSKPDAAKM